MHPAGLGNSERLMTMDTAYIRWADSYDADPNASELHPKRQYLGSQARFMDGKGETTRIQAYPTTRDAQ